MSKLEGLTLQQCRDVIGQFYKANIDEVIFCETFSEDGSAQSHHLPGLCIYGEEQHHQEEARKWKTSCEDDELGKRRPSSLRPHVTRRVSPRGNLLRKWMLTDLMSAGS